MRLHFLFLILSSVASAAELNSNVLRLIGDDAIAVYGFDFDRTRGSALARFYAPQNPPPFGDNTLRGMVSVKSPGSWLTIYLCDTSALNISEVRRRIKSAGLGSPAETGFEVGRAGVIHSITEDLGLVVLDDQTALSGDPKDLQEAIKKWSGPPNSRAQAAGIREISSRYDNWFFMVRPLQGLYVDQAGRDLKYRADLVDAIEELKGGIRMGGVNEVGIEVTTRRIEDAQTLAGIGQWLPAFLEAKAGPESRLVEAIENFNSRASGSIAYLSFGISDRRLQEILERDAASRTGSLDVR